MTTLDDMTLLAYVDGELDGAATRAVEAALQDNPAAQRKVGLLRESAALVRAAVNEPIHGPTPHRLLYTLKEPSPKATGRRSWRPWLVAAGIAALVASGFAAGFVSGLEETQRTARLASGQELVDEILAYHAFYTELPEGSNEARPDRAELEAWLSRHLKRAVRIPDLSGRGLSFDTARLFLSGSRPVVQIVYESPDQAPIALCIAAANQDEAVPAAARGRHGLNLISWQRDGYLYFVVGAAPQALLRELADEVSDALQQT